MIRLFFIANSDVAVAQSIRGKSDVLVKALVTKLTWLMLKLQQKIQTEKLQGQVLHQRSGKLVGSIRTEGVVQEASELKGSVQGAGGVAWYGIVHEKGGKGPYLIQPVNKKALAFFPSGSLGTIQSKTSLRSMYSGPMSARSLRPSKFSQFGAQGGVVVKSVMHPAAIQRSFMLSALEDMSAEIVSELEKTVHGTLSGV
jgi:hypothetical protein